MIVKELGLRLGFGMRRTATKWCVTVPRVLSARPAAVPRCSEGPHVAGEEAAAGSVNKAMIHRPPVRRSKHTAAIVAASMIACTACSAATDTSEERPVTQTAALDLESETGKSINALIPAEAKELGKLAGDIAGAYTGVGTAIEVGTKLLEMAGVLQSAEDKLAEQFKQLAQHIDEVAGNLSWQIGAIERERHIAEEISAVVSASETVRLGGKVDNQSAAALQSLSAVVEAESDTAFERLFVELSSTQPDLIHITGPGGTFPEPMEWYVLNYDPPVANGLVYDWRLGVPSLMQLIALRVQMIAAIDPSFTTDGAFDAELQQHSAALRTHVDKMLQGIRCGSDAPILQTQTQHTNKPVICVDIYSRQFASAIADSDSTVDATKARLVRKVAAGMPLYEMQSMINTLDGYVGRSGLARIPSPIESIVPSYFANANSLRCLDLQGGSAPGAGFNVEQYYCMGTPDQSWTYTFASQYQDSAIYVRSEKGARPFLGYAKPTFPSTAKFTFVPTDNTNVEVEPSAELWSLYELKDGLFEIRSGATHDAKLNLDVDHSDWRDMANVLLYHRTGTANQMWTRHLRHVPVLFVRAAPVFGTFEMPDASQEEGVAFQPADSSGEDKQKFYIAEAKWIGADHYFNVISKVSGLCMDVNSVNEGTWIVQRKCDGSDRQLWKFTGLINPDAPRWYNQIELHLENKLSGKCLDAAGERLTQTTCRGDADDPQWPQVVPRDSEAAWSQTFSVVVVE